MNLGRGLRVGAHVTAYNVHLCKEGKVGCFILLRNILLNLITKTAKVFFYKEGGLTLKGISKLCLKRCS